MEETKTCSTCKTEKPLNAFTKSKAQKTGYMGYCKACNTERNKRYRKDEATLERACSRVFSYLSRRVKEKGYQLDFDAKFLEELYKKQNGKCSFTGDPLELGSGSRRTLSVDRTNSSLGYLKENVTLVTWEVNNCKQDLSVEEFRELCRKVLLHGKD